MRTNKLYMYGSITGASLLLVFLLIYFRYDRWNPYLLNGKQFLFFYPLLMLACNVNARLLYNNSRRITGWLTGLCLLTGMARLIQGISHHKPVGYLALLLLVQLAATLLLRFNTHTPEQSI